jgi:hypothetical protein
MDCKGGRSLADLQKVIVPLASLPLRVDCADKLTMCLVPSNLRWHCYNTISNSESSGLLPDLPKQEIRMVVARGFRHHRLRCHDNLAVGESFVKI